MDILGIESLGPHRIGQSLVLRIRMYSRLNYPEGEHALTGEK